MVPLSVPNFEGNEMAYVMDAVGQGWVSTGGAYVSKFEENLSEYIGVPSAVACQSGTAALHLALIECGVRPGDLVIAPTLTFIAAVNPIVYCGASPVFMDCDDSLCINPDKLRDFCKNECRLEQGNLVHKKTGKTVRAMVIVHVFGNLADMEGVMSVAHDFNFKVVEDATEALGSYYLEGEYSNNKAGTIGDFGAYSFNGNKIITTGGGGMLVAKDESQLGHARYLSTQAKDDPRFYVHNEIGYNYRMTNVQAAIGVAQLEELEKFIARKNANYCTYQNELSDCSTGRMLPFRSQTRSNKWFYSFVVNDEVEAKGVENVINFLAEQGIGTRPIWGLISEQKPYLGSESYQIERARWYKSRVINLPCSTSINNDEIAKVCVALKQIG